MFFFRKPKWIQYIFETEQSTMLKELLKQSEEYRKKGKHSKSIEILNRADELFPKNADVLSERAVTYIKINRYSLAMIDMDAAIELEPENPYRYSCRAYLRSVTGNTQGAIIDYQKAIELDPKDAIALNNLGLLYEKTGNLKQAKQSFNESDDIQGIDMKQHQYNVIKEYEERQQLTPKKKQTIVATIWNVFNEKDTRNEFIKFIKQGFRLKK